MGNCLCCRGGDGGLESELGSSLLGKDGSPVDTKEVLAGKIVLLFFGAQWCPPCKTFTPLLVEALAEMKAQLCEEIEIAVVFVSFDHTEQEMMDYLKDDWYAVPFDQDMEMLETKYNATELPTVVVLAPDGAIITRQAKEDIQRNGARAYNTWMKKISARR